VQSLALEDKAALKVALVALAALVALVAFAPWEAVASADPGYTSVAGSDSLTACGFVKNNPLELAMASPSASEGMLRVLTSWVSPCWVLG
jgi:hypothetical protein